MRVLLLLCAACTVGVSQQEASPGDIFSGVVAELAPDSLTVVRKVPAKADVSRKFLKDDQTKVEGTLRVSARVTVSFKADDEGQLHALHIIVR